MSRQLIVVLRRLAPRARLVLAVAAGAAVASTPSAAHADLRLLTASPGEHLVAVAGDNVLVSTTNPGSPAVVELHRADASVVPLSLPGAPEGIDILRASPQTAAVFGFTKAANGTFVAFAGPVGGAFTQLDKGSETIDVVGSSVFQLRTDPRSERGALVVRRADGSQRRFRLRGVRHGYMKSAGPYLGVVSDFASLSRATVNVIDTRTMHVRARVRLPNLDSYALTPSGRVVALISARARRTRLVTSLPGSAHVRTLATARLSGRELAATPTGMLVLGGTPSHNEILRFGFDGRRTRLTEPVGVVDALDYRGSTLAFATANCVYAGVPDKRAVPSCPATRAPATQG